VITKDNGLFKAIQIAMEAEKSAAEFYADAAQKTGALAEGLFKQLEKFELAHYTKLVTLSKSLAEDGKFVSYAGSDIPAPRPGQMEKIDEGEKLSLMKIIDIAMDSEKRAAEAYRDLAEQAIDADGEAMFRLLADEEDDHYKTLKDAYWQLNQTGEWGG